MTNDLDRKARELAELFHGAYERLAPSFGYETRQETRVFDPASPNGQLMIAVCGSLISSAALRLAVPEWRPIETAPRDGTIVMIHERWEDVPIFASWHKGKWYADTSNYDGDAGVYDKICQHNVTHWQPLPAAPTLADEGE